MDTSAHDYLMRCVRFNQKDLYLIWYSADDEKDDCHVVLDENRYIRVFHDVPSLQRFAGENQIAFELEEPIFCNFDIVKSWLQNPRRRSVSQRDFLSVWNLCHDIANSVNDPKFVAYIDQHIWLWDGLLFSARPIRYKRDVMVLRRVLAHGIELFRSHIALSSKEIEC